MSKAERAISEWHSWLKSHGEEEVPPAIRINPVSIMHVTYSPAVAGKPEPLFWSEIHAVSMKDISRAVRLMDYSREDLLKSCSELDEAALHWKPKDEPRTIANTLRHIADVDRWYLERLNVDLPKSPRMETFELLRYTRELVRSQLISLPRQKRKGVFQPTKDPSPTCNLWTARKVLRRTVDHERLHARYIDKVIRMYNNRG